MKDLQTKREREKRMVSEMIALYCRKNHASPKGRICPECAALLKACTSIPEKCHCQTETGYMRVTLAE